MSLTGVNINTILSTKYLGGDNKAINAFLSMWRPPTTPLPPTLPVQAVQAVPQTQPSVVENAEHDESTVTARTVDLQPITMYQPVNESPSAC